MFRTPSLHGLILYFFNFIQNEQKTKNHERSHFGLTQEARPGV